MSDKNVMYLMYKMHPTDGWTAMRVTLSRLEARGVETTPRGILGYAARLVVPGARQLELREDLDSDPVMIGYRPWDDPTTLKVLDSRNGQFEGGRLVVKKA